MATTLQYTVLGHILDVWFTWDLKYVLPDFKNMACNKTRKVIEYVLFGIGVLFFVYKIPEEMQTHISHMTWLYVM